MNDILRVDEQVYVERGRYAQRHGKVVGYPRMFTGFIFVRLFDERGEVTNLVDVLPLAYVRRVVWNSGVAERSQAPGLDPGNAGSNPAPVANFETEQEAWRESVMPAKPEPG
jgi:hypothetical protein